MRVRIGDGNSWVDSHSLAATELVVELHSFGITVLSSVTISIYLSDECFVVFCNKMIDDVTDTKVLGSAVQ